MNAVAIDFLKVPPGYLTELFSLGFKTACIFGTYSSQYRLFLEELYCEDADTAENLETYVNDFQY